MLSERGGGKTMRTMFNRVLIYLIGEIPQKDDRWWHNLSPPPQFRPGTEGEGNILQSPCTRGSAHKAFGPTDLMKTYSVCTWKIFVVIQPRTSGLESDALTTRLPTVNSEW
ncbi:hypothetical protein TNCV_3657321 [Trichonephila clavipes]|nr:hypothetical protein TNCV_3657321 [Trichonephila clavipes]